jgi:hypothetical protein
MARVEIYSDKICNKAASHHVKSRAAVRRETGAIEKRAEKNLASARASSETSKYFGIDHQTKITSEQHHIDGYVSIEGPGAIAIEFGHKPSGVFKGKNVKSSQGLYILSRAAF